MILDCKTVKLTAEEHIRYASFLPGWLSLRGSLDYSWAGKCYHSIFIKHNTDCQGAQGNKKKDKTSDLYILSLNYLSHIESSRGKTQSKIMVRLRIN